MRRESVLRILTQSGLSGRERLPSTTSSVAPVRSRTMLSGQGQHMRRRQFLGGFGATAAWPFLAHAQQLPIVGFLSGRSVGSDGHLVQAFRDGIGEAGYVEGRNATIEFRWAEGNLQRLDALAAELIAHKPAVIFAGGVDVRIRALNKQLSPFPVVFATGGDPVALGLTASLARPGGHAAGATVISATIWQKRLELYRVLIVIDML